VIPGGEEQVLCECAQVFEEGLPGWEVAAYRWVAGGKQIEHGMGEEGQQDQAGQQGGEMLFAVAVVVLGMVPLVLRVLLFSFSIFQRLRPAATRAMTFSRVSGAE